MQSAHEYNGELFNSRSQRQLSKLRRGGGQTIPLARLEELLAKPREAPPPRKPLRKPSKHTPKPRREWPRDFVVKKEA